MVEKIIKVIPNLKVLSKMNEIIDGLNTHTANTNNPHNVTAEQLGLATAYVYKGSVTNFSDLPTNAQNGWVYSVENAHTDSSGVVHPAGANFAWDGSKWDDLGGSLSGYATLDFVENRVIPIKKGGTGATSVAGARNALGLGNTSGALPIANGGTGATTANGACKNLGAVQTVNGVAPDAKGNVEVSAAGVSNIVNIIYPVGSIYMSMSSTNPAELFGGTWERIAQGRCLIGAGTGTDSRSESKTFTAGATGGEYNHVLTVGELASHNHSASSSDTGDHYHVWYSGRYGNSENSTSADAAGVGANNTSHKTLSAGSHSHTITIGSNGSGSAHNNLPPYMGLYVWKRTA